MSCQLTNIKNIGSKNNWLNNILQLRVKIFRNLKRELVFIKNKILNLISQRKDNNTVCHTNQNLSKGDIVKVKSATEIKSMLDTREKYKGCRFIDEMYEYCGHTYRVLKIVDHFYDEAKRKVCKCKNTVLLEGVTCSGRQKLYSYSCDRNCFFFWHVDWLDKIS